MIKIADSEAIAIAGIIRTSATTLNIKLKKVIIEAITNLITPQIEVNTKKA